MTGRPWRWWVAMGLMLLAAPASAEVTVDHAAWDGLLKKYVRNGLVDYRGVQAERAVLDGYLAGLATVEPAQLPSQEARMAFWLNAYNACVFQGVLDHSPLRSVKDVKGFFDGRRYRVAGQELTLNEIEARERALGDWRGHFGVVCASHSCPPLRAEAYTPERVNDQLREQVTGFLQDAQRGFRLEGRTLWVSRIFDWYAGDFVPTAGLFRKVTPAALTSVLMPYLDAATVQALTTQPPETLKYLDYDWSLNAQPTAAP